MASMDSQRRGSYNGGYGIINIMSLKLPVSQGITLVLVNYFIFNNNNINNIIFSIVITFRVLVFV